MVMAWASRSYVAAFLEGKLPSHADVAHTCTPERRIVESLSHDLPTVPRSYKAKGEACNSTSHVTFTCLSTTPPPSLRCILRMRLADACDAWLLPSTLSCSTCSGDRSSVGTGGALPL